MRASARSSLWLVASCAVLLCNVARAHDDEAVRELVREELERQLKSESEESGALNSALDAAVERGIQSYIRKQRAAAEQARAQEQREKAHNLRPVDPNRDHILGDVDAPITLVEYSDFECPFCMRFHPVVADLMARNPGKVRWVYRHFPLDRIHPGARKLAEASECAAEIGGNDAFWAYTDLVYQKASEEDGQFAFENMHQLADEVGLDASAFAACVDSGRMAKRVQDDYQNGLDIGVTGTPASILANRDGAIRIVPGAASLEQLQQLVDELLAGG